MPKSYKLIIFDADGTLTPQRGSAVGPFSFTLLPGVAEKCAELRAVGAVLAIASNQSARRDVFDIDAQFIWTDAQLGIPVRLTCIATSKTLALQKPAPDMLNWIIGDTGMPRAAVLFVGDQPTDEQAARAAGVDFMWAADFFKQP